MPSLVMGLGALAIPASALPLVKAANADEGRTVIVKHGHHHDWDRHWEHRHCHKKVIIRHDHDHY